MAPQPIVYVVCSDRHRNGKTLLARVLVDFLLLDGGDPFVIDASAPEGHLRNVFPGRTALVDFENIRGRMTLFDTIVGSPGRDYVIDLPAGQTQAFCEASSELGFVNEARAHGFAVVVLFVVDKDAGSLAAAKAVADVLKPDLFVPVRNAHVGSAYRSSPRDLVIDMPVLHREVSAIIEDKRFSFRTFMLGEESSVPRDFRSEFKNFLHRLTASFREIGPVLSLTRLQH